MSDGDREDTQADGPEFWLEAVRASLNGIHMPDGFSTEIDPDWRSVLDDLTAIRQFAKALSSGDLAQELRVRGQLAGSLKALQAHLRHLTWQVQQVAQGDFSQQVEFMGEFSAAFKIMTENLHQARAEEHKQRLLAESLRDSAAALNSVLSLDEVIDVIMADLGQVVPHDTLDVLLLDDQQIARVVRCSGYDKFSPALREEVLRLRLPVSETPNLLEMVETGQPYLVNDIKSYTWVRRSTNDWARSHLGAPILLEGKAAGFLSLMSAQPNYFTSTHADLLMTFANQAAVAIQKAQLFERLNVLATTDGLTGIANRHHFMNVAEGEVARALRYQAPLAGLMLDLDHFKHVNDAHGHAIGDAVLRTVAEICTQSLRNIDLVGRYGGEEFAFLLPEAGIEQARITAERLGKAVANHSFSAGGRNFQVTASIGVAELRGAEDTLAALLDRADRALYAAKQAGRNCVKVNL